MILVFEMTWTGPMHAPGNSATIQIIARAWPEQRVRIHADPSHVEELRKDPALTGLPNVEFAPVPVSRLFLGRTSIVSARRAWREWRILRDALAAVPQGEGALVFLISTTATGSFAASAAAALSRRRTAVQIGFHGNLNEALGWRSRNPLLRAFDTRSALETRGRVPRRFLVLETAIRDTLARALPEPAERMDVLPLPINTAELGAVPDRTLGQPVRVGFVGFGTKAKGIDVFLAIAARLRARFGDRVEFVHVGCAQPGADLAPFAVLADPPETRGLPRAEFTARLGSLHYVMLPFRREGYYTLSASGALIDALTWLRPVIATRVPLTEQYFGEYGDIGHLCEDEAGLEAALEAVLSRMDAARYAQQVDAMRRARDQRRVEVLAARYRAIVAEGFPGLLAA